METFLNNIDKDKVTALLDSTKENVQYFEEITDNIVKSQTELLDKLMKDIYIDVVKVDNPALETIQKYFLELSNCLYFVNEKFERLGIYKSVAEAAYNDVRAKAVQNESADKGMDRKAKKTVAEITALADSASLYEGTVADIYACACSIIRGKLNAANTMINTLSKIMSARMSEMQLSMTSSKTLPVSKRRLDEDY